MVRAVGRVRRSPPPDKKTAPRARVRCQRCHPGHIPARATLSRVAPVSVALPGTPAILRRYSVFSIRTSQSTWPVQPSGPSMCSKPRCSYKPIASVRKGGGFQIAALKPLFAGVVQRQQRQLLRQPLPRALVIKIHFLQLADIRLAAGERRDAAAANHFPLLLHHPVGGARLAVQLIQLIEISGRRPYSLYRRSGHIQPRPGG